MPLSTADPDAPKPTPWSRSAFSFAGGHLPDVIAAVPEEEAWIADQAGVAIDTGLVASTLGLARRPVAFREGLALAGRLARNPHRLVGPIGNLVGDGARIISGRSQIDPGRGDRRYSDPAWRSNPFFRSLAQAHSALAVTLESIVDEADMDAATDYRLRLMLSNLVAAIAPPNFHVTNPAALKAVIDTGGGSILTGARRLVEDMREPPRLPARSDPSELELGVDIAPTPGAVVLRTPVMELLQLEATTPTVYSQPIMVVPSIINKYYLTDLSPGRSLVAHLVERGFQVFHMSWLNPTPEDRDFGLDTYIEGILDALGAVQAITKSDGVHALGVCAGGQLLSIAAGHMAATAGLDRIRTMTLPVSVLDHDEPASPSGLMNRGAAERAMKAVERKGIVDGRDLSASLAWLRPIDSIWWAWVERYLLAADIPKLDLFHWSEDTTNVPAALVRDMLELTLDNKLTRPDAVTVLGEPIDLGRVKTDAYLIAGLTDNLTPWRSCYRTSSLLGSNPRFVLVRGGHLQAILRPPGGRAGGFSTAARTPQNPEAWLARATSHQGSWWDHWTKWLIRRSDGKRPAPKRLGGDGYEPLGPAPGEYVRRRLSG